MGGRSSNLHYKEHLAALWGSGGRGQGRGRESRQNAMALVPPRGAKTAWRRAEEQEPMGGGWILDREAGCGQQVGPQCHSPGQEDCGGAGLGREGGRLRALVSSRCWLFIRVCQLSAARGARPGRRHMTPSKCLLGSELTWPLHRLYWVTLTLRFL